MSQDTPHNLRYRRMLDTLVVGFTTPYLQTEDLVEKVGTELFDLIAEYKPTRVVLSFDGVRFVSSSMLALIIKLHKAMIKEKGKLRICALAAPIRDVIHSCQFDRLLDIHEDETAALANFK
ncbi:MAG: STAS domain-containing protein [Isosphaeraceae bacterium]